MDSLLRVQRTGRRLTLTLDDARRQNALSVEMIESIDHALEGAPHDLAALVIQGADGVFSAGADLKSLAEALAKPLACGETDALQTLNAAGGRFFARFAALPFMTIAVVDGAAVGGGMGLAAASDVVIATPRARFALTETSLGIPPAQIAPYLVHRLGERVARRLAMTGARIDGREAETLGLADFYCGSDAERDAKLEALLQSVERGASGANAETKRLFRLTRSTTPEAYIDTAAKSFAEALRGPEGREGVARLSSLSVRRPGDVYERALLFRSHR
jgi:isohexenylglutaconyl-CoA hydratase